MQLFLKNLFSKTSSKKNFIWVLAFFIITAIYMLYFMVNIFAIFPTVLDLENFGYSTAKVIETFTKYGSVGMYNYKQLQIGDIVFPISVFLFSGSILYKIFKESNSWIYFIPLFYMVFDYLENFLLWGFRESFPHIKENLVYLASTFSILKHSFIALMFVFSTIKIVSNLFYSKKNNP